MVAKSIAKVSDPVTDAKLKVSFVRFLGVHLFWGDYWIVGLDREYQYAIVGGPSRKYGWIPGRRPEFSNEEWIAVKDILRSQGYKLEDFERTRHLPRQ